MVYLCHIFFIQSIIDGRFGWFQVFAIVNSSAVNIVCMRLYSRMIYNPSNGIGYIPSNGIAGSNGFSGSVSLRNVQSCIMVELIYTPTNSVEAF